MAASLPPPDADGVYHRDADGSWRFERAAGAAPAHTAGGGAAGCLGAATVLLQQPRPPRRATAPPPWLTAASAAHHHRGSITAVHTSDASGGAAWRAHAEVPRNVTEREVGAKWLYTNSSSAPLQEAAPGGGVAGGIDAGQEPVGVGTVATPQFGPPVWAASLAGRAVVVAAAAVLLAWRRRCCHRAPRAARATRREHAPAAAHTTSVADGALERHAHHVNHHHHHHSNAAPATTTSVAVSASIAFHPTLQLQPHPAHVGTASAATANASTELPPSETARAPAAAAAAAVEDAAEAAAAAAVKDAVAPAAEWACAAASAKIAAAGGSGIVSRRLRELQQWRGARAGGTQSPAGKEAAAVGGGAAPPSVKVVEEEEAEEAAEEDPAAEPSPLTSQAPVASGGGGGGSGGPPAPLTATHVVPTAPSVSSAGTLTLASPVADIDAAWDEEEEEQEEASYAERFGWSAQALAVPQLRSAAAASAAGGNRGLAVTVTARSARVGSATFEVHGNPLRAHAGGVGSAPPSAAAAVSSTSIATSGDDDNDSGGGNSDCDLHDDGTHGSHRLVHALWHKSQQQAAGAHPDTPLKPRWLHRASPLLPWRSARPDGAGASDAGAGPPSVSAAAASAVGAAAERVRHDAASAVPSPHWLHYRSLGLSQQGKPRQPAGFRAAHASSACAGTASCSCCDDEGDECTAGGTAATHAHAAASGSTGAPLMALALSDGDGDGDDGQRAVGVAAPPIPAPPDVKRPRPPVVSPPPSPPANASAVCAVEAAHTAIATAGGTLASQTAPGGDPPCAPTVDGQLPPPLTLLGAGQLRSPVGPPTPKGLPLVVAVVAAAPAKAVTVGGSPSTASSLISAAFSSRGDAADEEGASPAALLARLRASKARLPSAPRAPTPTVVAVAVEPTCPQVAPRSPPESAVAHSVAAATTTAAASTSTAAADPPTVAGVSTELALKFARMLKMGVPEPAVRVKMRGEGLPASAIDAVIAQWADIAVGGSASLPGSAAAGDAARATASSAATPSTGAAPATSTRAPPLSSAAAATASAAPSRLSVGRLQQMFRSSALAAGPISSSPSSSTAAHVLPHGNSSGGAPASSAHRSASPSLADAGTAATLPSRGGGGGGGGGGGDAPTGGAQGGFRRAPRVSLLDGRKSQTRGLMVQKHFKAVPAAALTRCLLCVVTRTTLPDGKVGGMEGGGRSSVPVYPPRRHTACCAHRTARASCWPAIPACLPARRWWSSPLSAAWRSRGTWPWSPTSWPSLPATRATPLH